MNELHRRLWAGAEAGALGRGGIAIVARATHLSRNTVVRGLAEVTQKETPLSTRVRRIGAGRKPKIILTPGLTKALEELVEPVTRGDPGSPLRWNSKSTRHLVQELNTGGYEVSHNLVAGILHDMEYGLQANRKTLEGQAIPIEMLSLNTSAKAKLLKTG